MNRWINKKDVILLETILFILKNKGKSLSITCARSFLQSQALISLEAAWYFIFHLTEHLTSLAEVYNFLPSSWVVPYPSRARVRKQVWELHMHGLWPQGCRALPLLFLPWGFQVTMLLSGPNGTCLGLIDKMPLGIPSSPPFSLPPTYPGREQIENIFSKCVHCCF